MILVVDCGNTDVKFGLWEKDQLNADNFWTIPSSSEMDSEYWVYRVASELLERGISADNINHSILSSVVPNLTSLIVDALYQIIGRVPILLNASTYDSLDIKVINKQEVGTDLVANAVAAYDLFKEACIIVDFGTALTFTTVLKDGTLKGVAIAPGLNTAVKSLLENTAQLPEVPLAKPSSALGSNTVEAIQAGVVIGWTGMIKHLIQEIKMEVGQDIKVIATGGLSNILKELDVLFDKKDPNLGIRGLNIAVQQITKSK